MGELLWNGFQKTGTPGCWRVGFDVRRWITTVRPSIVPTKVTQRPPLAVSC